MATRRLGAELLVLAIALGGCGRSAPSAESGAAPAVPVRVVTARARTVDRTVDVVGALVANQEAKLAAEVDGQVKEVLVDLGDRVKAGQVLVRIDTDLPAASLREAEVRYRNGVGDAERAERLRREGVTSEQETDRLRTTRDAARAARDVLALRVERATVRSPLAGAVTSRSVDVGDYARVGTPLVTVVDDRVLRLRGEVAERFVPELQVGQEVHGEVDAFPGLTVRGRVARLNAALDSKNRSLTLEAEIDNSDGRLRPGFFVRGTVLTQRGITTVSVPASVVQSFAGVSHVYVLSDNVARSREIQLGSRFEDDVEIVSGVVAGESVIASGLTRIHDGSPVAVEAPAARSS